MIIKDHLEELLVTEDGKLGSGGGKCIFPAEESSGAKAGKGTFTCACPKGHEGSFGLTTGA